jgi:hypothetical protein
MFSPRHNDPLGTGPSPGDESEGVGRIPRKDDFVLIGPDVTGDVPAGGFVRLRRLVAELVNGPMDIRRRFAQGTGDGIDNGPRFERGRCGVEVNPGLTRGVPAS